MSEKNAETLRALADAFNRRDAEALQALLAADVRIVPIRAALEDTAYSGPTAAADWLEAVDASWEDFTTEVTEVLSAGDRLVGVGRIRARGPASGANIDVEIASVVGFRDGLVQSLRIYSNRDEAFRAAGLSE
jgi:ketosteroid isomerase-like protein